MESITSTDEWDRNRSNVAYLAKKVYEQERKIRGLEADLAFAKKVIFNAVGDKTLVMPKAQREPTDCDFELSENESGEMLIRIHRPKVKVTLNKNIDLELEVDR